MFRAMTLLLIAGLLLAARQFVFASDSPATAPATQPATGFHTIGVEKFAELAKDPSNVILDVRTAREFKAGHIPGAVNIDVLHDEDFDQRVAKLDKSKTYLVHCASGGRSKTACHKLAALDFPNLYNLKGGFGAWKAANEPVTTDSH